MKLVWDYRALLICMMAFYTSSSRATTSSCEVCLPQNVDDNSLCQEIRYQDILKYQMAYRLVPDQQGNPYSLVDLTGEQLENIMILDPFTREYALSYKNMTETTVDLLKSYVKKELAGKPLSKGSHDFFAGIVEKLVERFFGIKGDIDKLLHLFGAIEGVVGFLSELQSYEEFEEIRDYFIEGMERAGQKYPSKHEPFQPINQDLMSDEYFAQQRLAGVNPMTIERVRTKHEGNGGIDWFDLKRTLNPKLHDLTNQMGENDNMFVLRYPLCDELPTQLDLTNLNFSRKMESTRSPIALFISDSTMKGELRPVAIQMDNTPDSPVYTPNDGHEDWMAAKLNVQTTDVIYGQMVEHLSKVHFLSETVCVALKRHLPDLHPLQQMLKFHCREVLVPNVIGAPILLDPVKGLTNFLFATGHTGAKLLIDRAYRYTTWDVTDFWGNIQDRGVEKEPEYFPYRDDGRKIFDAIQAMVKDYVALYYKNDDDVLQDGELQAFANELSADGRRPPDGGNGQVRGFPKTIETVQDLRDIITRFIFHVSAQHASVNYELSSYAAFVPNMPTKTYKRTNSDDLSFGTLPNKATATLQVVLTMVLGSLRYDKLFDYGDQLADPAAKKVLNQHFGALAAVGETLAAINARRKAAGQLTYPYLSPDWLPNGIQT